MTGTDPSQSSVVILSCSLNPKSQSHKLALAAQACLRVREVSVALVDLAEHDLPLCDGVGSVDHPSVKTLAGIIDAAGAILVSSPVYNYDLNAAAKNLMELTGASWTDKRSGFCASPVAGRATCRRSDSPTA
ncbi:MAG: NAD(P)H-dependent oxidoreductase [Acidobacteria bacterium]|nr:NAD(P)H-dependent oxidoreductase [Acidobacteriota bacterium]